MAEIATTIKPAGSRAEGQQRHLSHPVVVGALRYGVPLVLGAFLLFQVQPIIARCILPWFGGTPSVWTTCMLFFQVLLVGGYAYAHVLSTRTRPTTQAVVHWVVMGLSVGALGWMTLAWGTPLVPGDAWKPADPSVPVLRILLILLVAVGLPYLVLATTSPLLQAWFSRTQHGRSPYRLYALSNVGSLLGLLTYPFLIEPALTQTQQAFVWSGAYLIFCVSCAWCAFGVKRGSADTQAAPVEVTITDDAPPSRPTAWLWVGLPALASALLLAVTNHLCQNVAVVPFLWILPLSLYLLSFIVCFDHERWYWRPVFVPLALAAAAVGLAVVPHSHTVALAWQLPLYSVALFACCMVCHGELVALKPGPRHLTSFYLSVAVGGALGGVLVAVLAPVMFDKYTELPISLFVAFIVAVAMPGLRGVRLPRLLAYGRFALVAVIIASAAYAHQQDSGAGVLSYWRSFYGVLRVEYHVMGKSKIPTYVLLHGRTCHGAQPIAAEYERRATCYFTPESGVGYAINHHPRRDRAPGEGSDLRVGVIGLGIGTLAAYGEAGDYLRFYEINPDVKEIAELPALFTFLEKCPAEVDIAMGDARVSLERELQANGSQRFDVLVLDAFSGDAIPAHLLTREAFELYLQHLRGPDGALAVHLTNGMLDLVPVVWKLAESCDLDAVQISGQTDRFSFPADWLVLTPQRNYLRGVEELTGARWSYDGKRNVRLWTDDYYNLFELLK